MKKLFAIFLIAASAIPASADGLKSLESFMQGIHTGRADFTQTVTSPPREGQAGRSKTSSGTFEFQRPNRFKFVYQKPFAQSIVADGQTLWLHDVDLNQVTQRAQAKALGSTPALLAAAADLQALRAEFALESAPTQDGLEWVLARPKAKDGQLQSVRIGFAQGQLAALEIADSFGQQSTIRFTHLQTNPALPASTFQFKPPAGADVVRP
ncbi:MAG: outer membrane lipoprotein chaperone LolA [Burkholderiaceae bacterium]|nr:outer membrane lipoprotein chaperone LolA [Burkholderiaceae bacterium]